MITERQRVRDTIDSLYDGMSLEEIERLIAAARKYAAKNDYIDLRLDVSRGWNGDSDELNIAGLRWETDAEMKTRIAIDTAREKKQREYYEELKRKFEGT